jgi:hypothetical protein
MLTIDSPQLLRQIIRQQNHHDRICGWLSKNMDSLDAAYIEDYEKIIRKTSEEIKNLKRQLSNKGCFAEENESD